MGDLLYNRKSKSNKLIKIFGFCSFKIDMYMYYFWITPILQKPSQQLGSFSRNFIIYQINSIQFSFAEEKST